MRAYESWLADLDVSVFAATRDHVEMWLDSCHLGPRSRGTYLATLRAFYAWCVDEEVLAVAPTAKIRSPKTGRLMPHPTGHADLDVALEHADPRMRAWLTLGAFDGLRCVELANLRREDIREDAEPPVLIVRGKGDKERVLPLNEEAEIALRLFGLPPKGYVFRKADGSPMRAETISSYIGRYLRGLGITSSAHSLRHHFGSAVWSQTRDILAVKELMGHVDVKTTLVYVQFDPGASTEVVRQLGRSSKRAGGRFGGRAGGQAGDRAGGNRADEPDLAVDGAEGGVELEADAHVVPAELPRTDEQGRGTDVVPPVADEEHGPDVGEFRFQFHGSRIAYPATV